MGIIKRIKDTAMRMVIWLTLVAVLGIITSLLGGDETVFFILYVVVFVGYLIAISIYNHVSPVIARKAVVVSKRRQGLFRVYFSLGGSRPRRRMNRQQYITFEFLSDGKTKEFSVSKEEYDEFNEFDFGELISQGFKYIRFEKREE